MQLSKKEKPFTQLMAKVKFSYYDGSNHAIRKYVAIKVNSKKIYFFSENTRMSEHRYDYKIRIKSDIRSALAYNL